MNIKRRKQFIVIIIAFVTIAVMAGWYKLCLKPKVHVVNPEVVYTHNEIYSGEHVLYTTDIAMLQGTYDWTIRYQAQANQQFEVYAVDYNGQESLLVEETLSKAQNEYHFSTNNDTDKWKSYSIYFDYNGDDLFEVSSVEIQMDGTMISIVDANSMISDPVVVVDGKMTALPYHYATYTFNQSLVGENYYTIHSSTFTGDNVFAVVSQPDIFGTMPQIYCHGFDSKLNKIDFALDDEYEVGVCISDATTAVVDIYKYVNDNQEISIYADNGDEVYKYKSFVKGCMIWIALVAIVILIMINFIDDRKLQKLIWGCAAVPFGVAFWLWIANLKSYGINLLLLTSVMALFFSIICDKSIYGTIPTKSNMTRHKVLISLISVAVSMFILNRMLSSQEGTILYYFNSANKKNLIDYFLIVGVGIVLTLALGLLWKNKHNDNQTISKAVTVECVMAVAILVFAFVKDTISLGTGVNRIFELVCLVLIIWVMLRTIAKQGNADTLLYVVYIFVIIEWMLATGVVDIYTTVNMGSSSYHSGAYQAPLEEISKLQPFVGGERDLYGHYALFFLIPFQLFGTSSLVVAVMMGICGGLVALFSIGTMHKLTDSLGLRLLGAVAIGGAAKGAAESVYWQTTPHRLMFMAAILFLCASWYNTTLTTRKCVMGYIVCSLALLWNNESGMVCTLVWAVYVILRRIETKGKPWKAVWAIASIQMVGMLFAFFISQAIIQLYNFIAGGFSTQEMLSFEKSTGVLTSTSYMIDFHQTLWNWQNAEWVYMMIAFLLLITILILYSKLFDTSNSAKYTAMGMIGLGGAGLLTFFINRTEAGWGIGNLSFVMSLIMLLELVRDNLKIRNKQYSFDEMLKTVIAMVCVVLLATKVIVGLQTPTSIIDYRLQSGALDYVAYEKDLENFKKEIPAGTAGPTNALLPIYRELGWNVEGDGTYRFVVLPAVPEGFLEMKEVQVGDMTFYLCYNPGADE